MNGVVYEAGDCGRTITVVMSMLDMQRPYKGGCGDLTRRQNHACQVADSITDEPGQSRLLKVLDLGSISFFLRLLVKCTVELLVSCFPNP